LSIAKGSAAETDSWLDLLRRLGHLSDEEEGVMHDECLWIMESLKSKILDLERYEQPKRGSVKEAAEIYLVANDADGLYGPIWPFVDNDYL
jgi:23S rRNA-intervening sequence protein